MMDMFFMYRIPKECRHSKGFTLVELSVVLVIIGLIIGSVLAGKDLIRSAEVRAALAQIDRYNTAVNAFQNKYNALPGDMNNTTALAYGFASRPGTPGQGDGNGVIEGFSWDGNVNGYASNCETLIFWQDLTVGNPASPININLIDGSFQNAQAGNCTAVNAGGYTTIAISQYLPLAKIGVNNYVSVFSTNAINYFEIDNMLIIGGQTGYSAGLTVQQAYQMDKKIDDGLPITGTVQATGGFSLYENEPFAPAGLGQASDYAPHSSSPPSSTDCFDSTGSSYAIYVNNGAGINCGISFQFN